MSMTQRLSKKTLHVMLWAGLLFNFSVGATEPPPEPRFEIARFEVTGNSLIAPAALDSLLTGHTGSGRRFADVEMARQALLAAYSDLGYTTVQVIVPEQEITSGVIRLEVQERKTGKITVLGAAHHDAANIRASLPALVEGTVPNTVALAESLRLANENPTKQTQLLFRPAKTADEVEAVVRVEDDKPWKAFVSLDNSGNDETGDLRLAIGYQNANLVNRDHIVTLQYITSPEQVSDVTIFGAGYHIPLYGLGDSIDLYAGYSDVNSGTIEGLFNVSGQGNIFGARYTHNFDKTSAYEHKLSVGLDYRAYINNIDYLGQPIGTDVTVHPVSLTYNGQWTGRASQAGFYVTAAHNLPGGDKGKDADFAATRTGAEADYALARIGGSVARTLSGDWQLRAGLDTQTTGEPLVPGEQFGLGGHDSVRGFGERVVSGDRGYRASFEAYTPDLGGKTGINHARLRLLVFVEGGRVERLQPQPGETSKIGIASTGVGLRFGIDKNLSVRLDYGHVLDGGADKQPGDGRLHASAAYVF
jgi:hemolysin activation/secretion protein